jgi:hypothetical protein
VIKRTLLSGNRVKGKPPAKYTDLHKYKNSKKAIPKFKAKTCENLTLWIVVYPELVLEVECFH